MRCENVERELELFAFSCVKTQKTIPWSFISILQYQGSNMQLCHSPLRRMKKAATLLTGHPRRGAVSAKLGLPDSSDEPLITGWCFIANFLPLTAASGTLH